MDTCAGVDNRALCSEADIGGSCREVEIEYGQVCIPLAARSMPLSLVRT